MSSLRSEVAEPDIAERIKEGDRDAESHLVAFFQPRVFAMCLVRTRDPDTAHELTQETLLGVLEALRRGRLRDPERLAAFVRGAARNRIANYFRVRREHEELSETQPSPSSTGPHALLEESERRALVNRALADVSEEDREIVRLVLVEGLKSGAIARRLGLGSDLVRQRKSRVLKKICESVRKMSQSHSSND